MCIEINSRIVSIKEQNNGKIPNDFIEELIEKQYSLGRKKDTADFPDSPNDGER